MTIILDVTRLVRHLQKGRILTGIDRVSMAYAQYYKHSALVLMRWCGRSWVLPSHQSRALFNWLTSSHSTTALLCILIKGILFSNKIKAKQAFLINTGNVRLKQPDYLRLIRKWRVKPVFFVHDLIPILYPEYCNPGEDVRHKTKMQHVLTLAHGVILNSAATHDDLAQYVQQTQQTIPPTCVALLAPGMRTITPGTRLINKPYFVILSTIEPRKNHMLLLQLWRKLVQYLGAQTPQLVIIGQRGWECENVVDLLERSQFLNDVVTEIPRCTDADLITHIHHSQALLFPSFIEGYGLPLIEALSLGAPVIASDLAVFREIAGNVPDYIDPLDGKQWEARILDYMQPNSPGRNAQLSRMQHFIAPTWKQHFLKVDEFLSTLQSVDN